MLLVLQRDGQKELCSIPFYESLFRARFSAAVRPATLWSLQSAREGIFSEHGGARAEAIIGHDADRTPRSYARSQERRAQNWDSGVQNATPMVRKMGPLCV